MSTDTTAAASHWPTHCAKCNYSLSGRPRNDACPACGQAVRSSSDHDVIELTSASPLRAQEIAAELEEAGIESKLHELRGFQGESNNVWRVFVFARDAARARRVLEGSASRAAELEPIDECPACGHDIGGEAVAKCPECGIVLGGAEAAAARESGAPAASAELTPQEKRAALTLWGCVGVLGAAAIAYFLLFP